MKTALCCIGYNRPELMKLSVESVFDCRGIDDVDVFYSIDGNGEMSFVDPCIFKGGWVRFGKTGLSFNILESIEYLFDCKYDRVIIVEDDIIVSRDFIEYIDHAFKHKDEDCFSVSGYSRKCAPVSDGPDNLICKVDWYHPWGVAFDRADYALMEEHINDEYFKNPKKYMDDVILPAAERNNKPYYNYALQGSYNTLQAGLINSIRAIHGKRQIMPCMSRCQNIGYYGANQSIKSYDGANLKDLATLKKAMHHNIKFNKDYAWDELIVSENCMKNKSFCKK